MLSVGNKAIPRSSSSNWLTKKFAWVDTKVDGDLVLVSSAQVAQPVAVRHAWVENSEDCNVCNQAGLPTTPFRIDDWK